MRKQLRYGIFGLLGAITIVLGQETEWVETDSTGLTDFSIYDHYDPDSRERRLLQQLTEAAPITTTQITAKFAVHYLQQLLLSKAGPLLPIPAGTQVTESPTDVEHSFSVIKTENWAVNNTRDMHMLRYSQYYRGIKVQSGYLHIDILVERGARPKLVALNGSVAHITTIVTPAFDAETAIEKFRTHIVTIYYPTTPPEMFEKKDQIHTAELIWSFDKQWQLIYLVSPNFWVEADNGLDGRWPIGAEIDAVTGNVLGIYEGARSCFGPPVELKERR